MIVQCKTFTFTFCFDVFRGEQKRDDDDGKSTQGNHH